MLLAFNPKSLLKINQDFIICFFIGVVATTIGGIVAGYLFHKILPQDYWYISGQLTASFIGGYENAVSVGIGLHTPTPIFLQAFAGDSVLTALWIIVNIFQGKNIVHSQDIINNEKNPFVDRLNDPIDITSMAITMAVI